MWHDTSSALRARRGESSPIHGAQFMRLFRAGLSVTAKQGACNRSQEKKMVQDVVGHSHSGGAREPVGRAPMLGYGGVAFCVGLVWFY